MTTDQSNDKTPKWLRRLEKESWQAELIISGLALYGALYLPEFVYWLSDTLIDFFPVNYYLAGYTISFFYLFGVSILTTFFIIHFILRAYWIGLIGLNSVYPNSYNIEDGFYSPIYSRLYAAKLPKIRETIKAVDKQCSSMFSGAFVFMLMYGMMSVTFSIILGIYMLTKEYVPFPVWIVLGVIFAIITIVMSVFGMMGKSEKYRHNEKLQTNFFRLSYVYGNFTSPFVFKPLNQIVFTFSSNAKKASSNLKIVLPFMLVSMFLTMYHIDNSNIGIMIVKGTGENINISDKTIYSNNYLDQYEAEQNIFVPVIESDVIEDPFIKLFIPILKNESYIQEEICGEYEKDDTLDKDEADIKKIEFNLNCCKQYINIYLNGVQFDADLMRHRNPQGDRKGVLCYIPSNIFTLGKNNIRVEKIKNTDQELYDSYLINFWYSPSN